MIEKGRPDTDAVLDEVLERLSAAIARGQEIKYADIDETGLEVKRIEIKFA